MKDLKAGIDKLLATRNTMFDEGAEFFKEKTIGQHVSVLIAQDGEISIDTLLRSLAGQAEDVATQIAARKRAKAAFDHLTRLLASRSGS